MRAPLPTSLPAAVTMRQLRAFVAVAQEGSITRAAQRLFLTPSALSMLIASLEGELSVRLFERTTRRVSLSDAGAQLLPSIKTMFENLDVAVDGLRRLADRHAHRFTMATSPLLASTLIPHLMASFEKKFPRIRVELLDLPVEAIAESVRSGHADFGICTADLHAQDLHSTLLYQDRLVLACPPGHPLAALGEVTWAGLRGEALVLLRQSSSLRTLVQAGFAKIGESVEPAYEVAHVATAVGMVRSGLGISILPSFALSNALTTNVVAVPLVAPVIARDVVVLHGAGKDLPDPCEAFLAHFREEVAPVARVVPAPSRRFRIVPPASADGSRAPHARPAA
jgi:LysR family transcriptional regulator, carnitine catabolism transcriptional activator